MSEFAWNTADNHDAEPDEKPRQQPAEAATLTLSADDFSALEERVLRAVEVVRRERHARVASEERVTVAEARVHEGAAHLEQLEKEISALRAERDQVRERVERLLGQLDALEL
jgi:FtsZ-binding cell division protein ZapB